MRAVTLFLQITQAGLLLAKGADWVDWSWWIIFLPVLIPATALMVALSALGLLYVKIGRDVARAIGL